MSIEQFNIQKAQRKYLITAFASIALFVVSFISLELLDIPGVETPVLAAIGLLAVMVILFGMINLLRDVREFAEYKTRVDHRYRQIFEQNTSVKLLINPENGIIVDANSAASSFYGYSRETLLSMKITDINVLDEAQIMTEMQRTKKGDSTYYQFRHRLANGIIRDVEVYTGPIDNADGTLLYSIIHDITDRVENDRKLHERNQELAAALEQLTEAQQRMIQQERLAAVGQLTAGIAHDFNNILTGITGYAEILKLSPGLSGNQQKKLTQIVSATQRAAKLVSQMLDFSRKSIRQVAPLNIVTFIEDTVQFLRHTIPERIEIRVQPMDANLTIDADSTQLQQVITNMVINAKDAMPGGGTIIIAANQVTLTESLRCRITQQQFNGDWLELRIHDNGHGIPHNLQDRIFEPFFTTKSVGAGTGLGLSQVYGIIQQHKGHLTLTSTPESGTDFRIYLPIGQDTEDTITGPDEQVELADPDRVILLVEDEPTVLEATSEMLAELGYSVLTATNGRDAIDIYRENAGMIDLVISDLILPLLDGEEMFRAMKQESGDLRLIFMSGYPLGSREEDLKAEGVLDWIQKPVDFITLSRTVKNALNRV